MTYLTFSQKEYYCESLFEQNGPYWHICTPGEEMEVMFTSEEDFRFGMNAIALAVAELSSKTETDERCVAFEVVTFELMSDHIHLIMRGPREICLELLSIFRTKMRVYMAHRGRSINWSGFKCDDPIEITDIEMLRNEIIYVNRNGYVASKSETPYSYRWGSGYLYYGIVEQLTIVATKASDLTYRQKRKMFRADKASLPERFVAADGYVLPQSFCNIRLGMSIFRDAHHYFNKLTKAFEAYSESAARLGDKIFLADGDLYAVIKDKCRKSYGTDSPNLLQPTQKLDLAKILHRQYNASNGQIRRMLKLDASIINELFPDGSSERK